MTDMPGALAQPSAHPPMVPRLTEADYSERAVQSGIVDQYILNSHGDVDGLYLLDGKQVNFPPHLTMVLTRAVKAGDRIVFRGRQESEHVIRASEITNETTGEAIRDKPPVRGKSPALPAAPLLSRVPKMLVRGTMKALLYGPKGDVNGLLLSDKTTVRMPPETSFKFVNVFQHGDTISVEGEGCENHFGRCIEASAIGVNGLPSISVY